MSTVQKMIGWPLLALVLASCVTINVYFPAAETEQAARTIVRDVLGNDAEVPPTRPEGEPQSQREVPAALWLVGRALELMVPSAHAAQANIDISSPAIKRLRQSMSQRQRQLDPYYRAGAVGFANNGNVSIRDASAVGLRERAKMNKLVADENADRAALYREIARANGHPEWESQIRSTFARVWAEEARSGYWVQKAGGAWSRK